MFICLRLLMWLLFLQVLHLNLSITLYGFCGVLSVSIYFGLVSSVCGCVSFFRGVYSLVT